VGDGEFGPLPASFGVIALHSSTALRGRDLISPDRPEIFDTGASAAALSRTSSDNAHARKGEFHVHARDSSGSVGSVCIG
jgi:hypothetical protein